MVYLMWPVWLQLRRLVWRRVLAQPRPLKVRLRVVRLVLQSPHRLRAHLTELRFRACCRPLDLLDLDSQA